MHSRLGFNSDNDQVENRVMLSSAAVNPHGPLRRGWAITKDPNNDGSDGLPLIYNTLESGSPDVDSRAG